MKYLITSSKSTINSIEIADDLSSITLKGDVRKIRELLPFLHRYYVFSYIYDEVRISGLDCSLIAFPTLIESIRNHPSIYGGIYSVRFILSYIFGDTDGLYHQILEDVNRLSAALDQKFYLETMQFRDVMLWNPQVLPKETAIVKPGDADSFKGRIVAFKTNIPYFARSNFVSPADPRYRFALIDDKQLPRGDYTNTEFGFTMYCFMASKDNPIDTPLIHTFLKLGRISMRLATVEELKYLLAADQLNQGFFVLFRSYTKVFIQREIARHKATPVLLEDASKAASVTDDLIATSSNQAACSTSQALIAESSSTPLFTVSPSYMPGYHSKGRSRHHSRSHVRHNSSRKRTGRKSR